MSICLVSIVGDASKFADRLRSIKHLSDMDLNCVVLCKSVPARLARELQPLEFVSPEKPVRGLRYFYWAARETKRICKRHRESSCFVMEVGSGITLVMLKIFFSCSAIRVFLTVSPCKQIFVEKGWLRDRHGARMSLMQRAFLWCSHLGEFVQEFLYLVCSQKVVSNSPGNLTNYFGRSLRSKTVVIPNCVSLRDNLVDEKHDNSQEQLRILFIGRLEALKGFGCALETLRLLKLAGCQFECKFVGAPGRRGEQWLENTWTIYESDLGRCIRFVGNVDSAQVVEYLDRSDVLFLPTFYEGSPRVALEALASGCAVVASDLPGIRALDFEEKVLELFPAGAADAACNLLLRIDRRPILREVRKMHVRSHFSPQKRAERLKQFLIQSELGSK